MSAEQLKIAIYTMAKNEAEHVKRYAETTQGADYVVVTDTGSTDGTQDLLRTAGIAVKEARIMPWRFDHGTNAALHNVPDDVDICIKLDLDEVLFTPDGSHWRTEIEKLWKGNVNQIHYWYTWSWLVPGEKPAVKFKTGCIHSRHNWHWRHPGHAALTCMQPVQRVDSDLLEIHHYMVNKKRPDYVPLLELAVQECRSPRTIYYLGREYHYRHRDKDAVNLLNEYLAHPDSHWAAERASAMHMIGLSYERLGVHDQAVAWLIRATAEYPGCRDLWFELLRYFTDLGDFHGGMWAGTKCLSHRTRKSDWVGQVPAAWNEAPYAYMAKCALHTGIPDKAAKFADTALEMNSENTLANEVKVLL